MKLIHTEYNLDGTVKAVKHLDVSEDEGHEIMKDEVWRAKMGFPEVMEPGVVYCAHGEKIDLPCHECIKAEVNWDLENPDWPETRVKQLDAVESWYWSYGPMLWEKDGSSRDAIRMLCKILFPRGGGDL